MPAQSLHHWLAGSPSPLSTPTATSGCKEDRSNLGPHCERRESPQTGQALGHIWAPQTEGREARLSKENLFDLKDSVHQG